MVERPILFSAPMVRAVLDGTKSMTRRVIKPQPPADAGDIDAHPDYPGEWFYWLNGCERSATFHCPYGQPGDRLWVREAHFRFGKWIKDGKTKAGKQRWRFRALNDEVRFEDSPPPQVLRTRSSAEGWYKRPSIFLPRWASRILLAVVSVRVERLQDISAADAQREGVQLAAERVSKTKARPLLCISGPLMPDQFSTRHPREWTIDDYWRFEFALLWQSINGKRPGCDWASNPWLWVVSFRRVESTEARATA